MPVMPVSECTRCGRRCRAYVPHHGDGSVLVTYWHKNARDDTGSAWCRSEVDEADYTEEVEHYLYRRSLDLAGEGRTNI